MAWKVLKVSETPKLKIMYFFCFQIVFKYVGSAKMYLKVFLENNVTLSQPLAQWEVSESFSDSCHLSSCIFWYYTRWAGITGRRLVSEVNGRNRYNFGTVSHVGTVGTHIMHFLNPTWVIAVFGRFFLSIWALFEPFSGNLGARDVVNFLRASENWWKVENIHEITWKVKKCARNRLLYKYTTCSCRVDSFLDDRSAYRQFTLTSAFFDSPLTRGCRTICKYLGNIVFVRTYVVIFPPYVGSLWCLSTFFQLFEHFLPFFGVLEAFSGILGNCDGVNLSGIDQCIWKYLNVDSDTCIYMKSK